MLSARRCRLGDHSANIPNHLGWVHQRYPSAAEYADDLDADHLGMRDSRDVSVPGALSRAPVGLVHPPFPVGLTADFLLPEVRSQERAWRVR
jgi:hypothetical protein